MKIKNNIKKITLGILGATILSAGLWACSDEDNLAENSTQIVQAKSVDNFRYRALDFNNVGEQHNVKLDEAYDYLVAESVNNNDKKDFIEDLDYYFLDLLPKMEHGHNFTDFIKNKNFVTFQGFNHYTFLNTELTSNSNIVLSNLDYYLSELELLIDNSLISEISELESTIFEDESISNEELFVFYNISSVSKHSMRYWKENGKKWGDLVSEYTTNSWPPKDGWSGRVLKQDAMGAGAGAVYAWWVNGVPGAGQILYGTAIGATSASFSAASLIDEVWPWD